MCDANPKSFEYVKRIIDFTLGQFDFVAVHLESCDLGCCWCPQCAGRDGVVGYNVRINRKTANYIKQKWPHKIVYVITINWVSADGKFSDEEMAKVVELSQHVDCVFDQGHTGYHVPEAKRRSFIDSLHCDYGTSGRLWLYPDTRWDRASYFLPYPKRACEALVKQFDEGVRGCLYYQGPVSNAGQELMIAVGGRILSDTRLKTEDVLREVLESFYRPRHAEAARRLGHVIELAEETYFGQWSEDLFRKAWRIGIPGEFKLDQGLWGTSPGPATYLKEPCLDARGRKEYRKGLVAILVELAKLEGQCDDGGRLANIQLHRHCSPQYAQYRLLVPRRAVGIGGAACPMANLEMPAGLDLLEWGQWRRCTLVQFRAARAGPLDLRRSRRKHNSQTDRLPAR